MLDRDRLLQLARTYWLALVVGLFPLLYAGMGFVYYSAGQAKEAKTELLARQQAIARGAAGRVQEVEAQYQALQEAVPPASLNEIDVFRAMRNLVVQSGLDPTYPAFAGESQRQVGKEQYRVLSFLLTVRGDSQRVWAFVQKLDKGETVFKTLVVEKTILRLGNEDGEATMNFIIFTKTTGQ